MSWMYGEDYQYAASRLDGTVVRHNNMPVVVHGIRRDGMATLIPLGDANHYVAEARELDCTPVPLGYVNSHGSAIYCQRVPARRYRQGLSEVTLCCTKNGGARVDPLPVRELKDCILNNYPPYEDAVKSLIAVAWHRDWASSMSKLFYKGFNVGAIVDGLPVLEREYTYLEEALHEDCDALVRAAAAA